MSEKNGMDSGPGMGRPFATFARLQVFSPTSTPVPIIYSLTNNQNKRPYNHPNQHPSTAPNRTTLSTSSLDSPSLHLLISPLTLSAFLLNTPPCFPLAFSNTFSSSAVASAVVPVMLTLEPWRSEGPSWGPHRTWMSSKATGVGPEERRDALTGCSALAGQTIRGTP